VRILSAVTASAQSDTQSFPDMSANGKAEDLHYRLTGAATDPKALENLPRARRIII